MQLKSIASSVAVAFMIETVAVHIAKADVNIGDRPEINMVTLDRQRLTSAALKT